MSHCHRLIDERPLYWLVYTFAIRGNTIIANTMAKTIRYVRQLMKDWSRSDPAPQALLTLSSIQLIQLAKRVREGIKNDLEAVLPEHGFCVAQGMDIDTLLSAFSPAQVVRAS